MEAVWAAAMVFTHIVSQNTTFFPHIVLSQVEIVGKLINTYHYSILATTRQYNTW